MATARLRVEFFNGDHRVFDDVTTEYVEYDGNKYLEISRNGHIVADYLKREVFDARPVKAKTRAHTGR